MSGLVRFIFKIKLIGSNKSMREFYTRELWEVNAWTNSIQLTQEALGVVSCASGPDWNFKMKDLQANKDSCVMSLSIRVRNRSGLNCSESERARCQINTLDLKDRIDTFQRFQLLLESRHFWKAPGWNKWYWSKAKLVTIRIVSLWDHLSRILSDLAHIPGWFLAPLWYMIIFLTSYVSLCEIH